MQFRTEISLPPYHAPLTLHTRLLTMGSCFADVLGQRLEALKMPMLSNPFGTVFNPLSLVKLLTNSLQQVAPDTQLYVQHQGLWWHYDYHTSWWHQELQELTTQLQQQQRVVRAWLQQTEVLVLTLGTAFVYRHRATGQRVANCHKIPASEFQKELLSVEEVVASLSELYNYLQDLPQPPRIILTVSPVRHTRDTLPLNAVSKSVLRVACHEACERLMSMSYFPAYELLLDDLRDYRFYESDLIHPNEVAETYIFERFKEAYFAPELHEWATTWQKITQSLAHRPLQPNSEQHRIFLNNLLKTLHSISTKVDVSAEIHRVEQQLAN